ncbi:MAG: phosphate/phosphite/phosphonate ABC transporter substrate-binding protein [Halobacteriovoraceae bacterium]|nr:phosphate/phosphite/phosphonate ABC transporter substrate-binding protein [Halobacteriovoraceae bacterium]
MEKLILAISTLLVLVFNLSCVKQEKLGSQNNPIKLYFTPSVDSDTITTNSDVFIKFLEKETGLYFKTGIPTSYIAVVESFGSKRADIAVMNSFGYLLAHSKYGAQAKLRVIRYGHDYYQGQIIVKADSGIEKLSDLNNKKFAFTDSSSTSGYMFPLKILKDEKINLGGQVFAMKHDNVVTMVYQGQVDAGATFYSEPDADGKIRDARARVKTQFPDVEEKIKILKVTEKIPNDPFVFRKELPKEITDKFISAVKKFITTDEGKTIFENIYSVNGLADTTDEDYDGLRNMVKAINVDAESILKNNKGN